MLKEKRNRSSRMEAAETRGNEGTSSSQAFEDARANPCGAGLQARSAEAEAVEARPRA
jgi:hypothetical protein